MVTDPCAVKLLTDFIHDHTIYKSPVDYLYGRDTGYIESCNNVAFIYLDKRIHYGESSYKTRQGIWVLDVNKHVFVCINMLTPPPPLDNLTFFDSYRYKVIELSQLG